MEQYLIYLRKSRQDRDQELLTGSFDTLERHRSALLRLAQEQSLTVSGILEEVVTGDTIAERPKMQELLQLVETGRYAGVLVMEVQRLSRGNTRDQGVVAETFQYSGTKIITPTKTYDPRDEADEEYFEFGLFMSRREYKAINKRLHRGRMASLQEGKYIAGTAPYGYEKYKLPKQKGYSLQIVEEEAEVVRRIFRMYTSGEKSMGSFTIANQLNAEGTVSPGGLSWTATAVRDILKNPVYAGYVRWAYRPQTKKVVDGQVVVSAPVSKTPSIVKGLHEPIVPEEVWRLAGKLMRESAHAPVPGRKQVSNPLAGLIYCSACGRSMVQMHCGKNKTARIVCPTHGCVTVSSRLDETEDVLLQSLRRWLIEYRLQCDKTALPNVADDTKSREAAIQRMEKTISGLRDQQHRLYDLLEQGVYTTEVFFERSRLLAERVSSAEAALREAREAHERHSAMESARTELIPRIERVLADYAAISAAEEKNVLLKDVLQRALYTKTKGGKWDSGDIQLHLFPKLDATVEFEK